MIIKLYVPNTRAPTYMKQILIELKGEKDSYGIIIGDFNTPLSITGPWQRFMRKYRTWTTHRSTGPKTLHPTRA